jgi:hypothetical protein
MSIERTEFPRVAKASAAFFLCWLSGFVISYMWVYSHWRLPSRDMFYRFDNLMWFYPQYVLPHGFGTKDAAGYSHEVMSAPTAMILGILFWVMVGFAFAWFTRRLRLHFTIPLAVVAIFVAVAAAQALLSLFGIEAYMDGP